MNFHLSQTIFMCYFSEPFDMTSWILILLLCIHVVSILVFTFEYTSPNGLNKGLYVGGNFTFHRLGCCEIGTWVCAVGCPHSGLSKNTSLTFSIAWSRTQPLAFPLLLLVFQHWSLAVPFLLLVFQHTSLTFPLSFVLFQHTPVANLYIFTFRVWFHY